MKLTLLFFALVSLITVPVYAAPTFVQSNYGEAYPKTQGSVTFSNPVTAGSLLVLAIRMSNGGGATSVTSTGGRTWTRDRRQMSVLDWSFEVWSLPNAPAGTTTITAQVSGTADQIRMAIVEYSGVSTSSPVHAVASDSATSGTANAGSVTTTIENCLLFVAVATDSDGEGWQAGAGYTLRPLLQPVVTDKIGVEDRGPVGAGTWSGTMRINSDTWAAILVAYKQSGGSTVLPPAPPSNLRIIR